MKIFLITLFLLISCSFSPFGVKAIDEEIGETVVVDEQTREISNKYFDLTLTKGPQSAFGKHIPYTLTITPHIDSPRTQIIWNTPTQLEVSTKHSEFVSLERNQTYDFNANISPLREGSYSFSVSVVSWQHNINYTNAINHSLTFNSNLVSQPVDSEYQIGVTLKYVGIVLAFILMCLFAILGVKKLAPKAQKWLTPPT